METGTSDSRTLVEVERVLELIDMSLFPMAYAWNGTANDLQQVLTARFQKESAAIFTFQTAAGTYLGKLAKSDPKRVEKITTSNGNRWLIHPPPA